MSTTPSLDSAFVAKALATDLIAHDGPPTAFRRAVIDSRLVAPGDLFVALPGEHSDGHDFAMDAVRRGAAGLLLSRQVAGTEAAARFVVSDTLHALQHLAVTWRGALPNLQVIGVTGNVGKSTTKLITAAVLGEEYRVQAHRANYNNEIGVPLCLLELRPDTDRAVIEMGMYTTGEIALLCRWTRPRAGIVLNVGPVHLERAGSLEAIARAKRELPEALPPDGDAILNIDDPLVEAMAEHTAARVWRTGTSPAAEVRGTDVVSRGADGFDFTLAYQDQSRRVHIPLPGGHLVTNVLTATAAGLADGIEFEAVCAALEVLDIPTRLTIHRLPHGVTILDDTYNASPAATIAALDLLRETPGRRLALLGDMLELGEVSTAEHARVGRHAAEVVDALFTVGKLAQGIADAARSAGLGRATHCESKDEALERVQAELRPGDVLLVKASRALALETLVQALTDAQRAGIEESR